MEEVEDNSQALRWQAPEFEYKEKTADWFWAVAIISICAAVASAIFSDWLFSIVIILGAIVLTAHSVKKPRTIDYEINQRGVIVNDTQYYYTSLESFWVEHYESQRPKVIIKSKKMLMMYILMPLEENLDPNFVREYLMQFLKEEEHHEPLSQKVMEYLGF